MWVLVFEEKLPALQRTQKLSPQVMVIKAPSDLGLQEQ